MQNLFKKEHRFNSFRRTKFKQRLCQFIIDLVKLPNLTSNNMAWKSVMGFGIGETDLLFSYKSKNETIFILIENKLNADFQYNQHNECNKSKKIY